MNTSTNPVPLPSPWPGVWEIIFAEADRLKAQDQTQNNPDVQDAEAA